MIEYSLENFDIRQIHQSGQCFRMEEIGDGIFRVLALDRCLELTQEGQLCRFSCSREEFQGFWKNYFDLDTDYNLYRNKISSRDKYLCQAARLGGGIRILRQDLWEMIISFLISQQNNIVRIRRCIRNICERYGEELRDEKGEIYYVFPSPQALSQAGEEELRDCNLGYRSKYVSKTAGMVARGEISLEDLKHMTYPQAREELLKLYGIGEKVADCICLFGLHHMEAFPVDTHIRQALEKHYKKGFPMKRYAGCQGVMQQYIFYYEYFCR